ncbi:MAG: class I SAM-dependent methyltransferase family protein [Candidatus Lokiarchaeota archaeon]|nr:class I SAM-dependent methyltransferase family protein [Candidatus Lokiarchaeota archaeon]
MNDKEIYHVKVKKEDAQYFIGLLERFSKEKSIIYKNFKVIQENKHVLFPIDYEEINIKKIISSVAKSLKIEIVKRKGVLNKDFKFKTLEDALISKIPKKYLEQIPKSFDIIGNIAIIELDMFDMSTSETDIKNEIALAIIEVNKNVKSVFEKVGEINGVYRLRKLRFIRGINNKETIHKENNCNFNLDIEKTFFTPRLLSERKRISNNNFESNEKIVDLFAGVGPFSIQIAKNNDVNIYCFDINPDAFKYLNKNIKLNKLKGTIHPILLNVNDLLNNSNQIGARLKHKIDRVIMNLPESSLSFINIACHLIKKEGGIIHNYQFCDKPNSVEKAIDNIKNVLNDKNWKLCNVNYAKVLKHISAKKDMIVIDAYIKKPEN